jgi:hypothetical protein
VHLVNGLVRLSHGVDGDQSIGSVPAGSAGGRAQRGAQSTQETAMSNLRHIVISVTILASFLLVLAAPFRWF